MGKALSIKDTATYDLVFELATLSSSSMSQAVEEASKAHLNALLQARFESAKLWLDKVKSHEVDDDFMAERWQPPIEDLRQ
jgi:hypothetical protein